MATPAHTASTTASTTATRWLDDREMFAWRTFIDVSARLDLALEQDLAPLGLAQGDYQVLVVLSEAPEHRMRMCDLAGLLQLSPSGLTRRLDGLVRDGLVTRAASDTDRRVMLAVLTEAGLDTLAAAAPHHVESVRTRVLDRLSDAQIDQLAAIFTAIGDGLDMERP
jgi:DNA-binding MarR family transcriptional regulator